MPRRFRVNKRTQLPLPEESPIRVALEERARFQKQLERQKAEELQSWCDRHVRYVADICRPEHYKEALLMLRKRFCEETGQRDPLAEEF